MEFLLISSEHQAPLIDALLDCYERFKVRDREQAEELSREGVIVCYGNLHLMYEMPLSSIRLAERLSVQDGLVCPPPLDLTTPHFFLLGDNYRRDLSRMLNRDGYEELGEVIASARTIILPEVHTFIDAENGEYEVVGWDEDDARRRVEEDGRAKLPLRWSGRWLAFPSRGAVYRGRAPFLDEDEGSLEQDDATSDDGFSADLQEVLPFTDANPDSDDIPF
jgi:hypothetical protein